MLKVCAWCGPKPTPSEDEISHGLCLSCMQVYFPEAYDTFHPQENYATSTTLDNLDALHTELDALLISGSAGDAIGAVQPHDDYGWQRYDVL